jgi:hypothetical protein
MHADARPAAAPPVGTVTSIRGPSARPIPHSPVALRCDRTAPGPVARTAASQRPFMVSVRCPTAYTP